LDFRLTPRPRPEIAVAPPGGSKRVTAGAAVQPRAMRGGDSLTLFVKARIAPGHHIYALDDSGTRNIATSIDVALPGWLSAEGPWRGPEPKLNADGSRTLAGEVLFQRRFVVASGNAAGNVRSRKLAATLRFQVCNDAVCWPPETIHLETEF